MTIVNNNQGKLHPALWVAAIAVTLFSLVGIGAVTGILPSGKAEPAPTVPPAAALALNPVAPQAAPASPVTINQNVAAAPAPKPAVKVAAAEPRHTTAVRTRRVATNDSDIDVYRSEPRYDDRQPRRVDTYSSEPSYSRANTCVTCGTIESVSPVVEKGEGSGLGAIAGGVAGAVVGNQIGKGGGRDIARIVGIAGGAYAGHQIEKSQRSHTSYDIAVRMQDGSVRHVRQDTVPAWQAGDPVRYEDGRIFGR